MPATVPGDRARPTGTDDVTERLRRRHRAGFVPCSASERPLSAGTVRAGRLTVTAAADVRQRFYAGRLGGNARTLTPQANTATFRPLQGGVTR